MKSTKRFLRSKKHLVVVERYKYGYQDGFIYGIPYWRMGLAPTTGPYCGIGRTPKPIL